MPATCKTMSPEQLDFVRRATERLKEKKHVFVFLHHPRWIGGGYAGGNWDETHAILAEAGNVRAVFAGHIHRLRYSGVRDGIAYHALATTGGGDAGPHAASSATSTTTTSSPSATPTWRRPHRTTPA